MSMAINHPDQSNCFTSSGSAAQCIYDGLAKNWAIFHFTLSVISSSTSTCLTASSIYSKFNLQPELTHCFFWRSLGLASEGQAVHDREDSFSPREAIARNIIFLHDPYVIRRTMLISFLLMQLKSQYSYFSARKDFKNCSTKLIQFN